MPISRREVLVRGAASLAALTACARPQRNQEVVIGAVFPLSGASATAGVDARHALETAVDVINTAIDIDLPLAGNAGVAGFQDGKLSVIYADHQGRPAEGRAEAERLITQRRVAALIGVYHSAVAVTVS
jgi:branched-chain amino acid transport system substrate-binding protein